MALLVCETKSVSFSLGLTSSAYALNRAAKIVHDLHAVKFFLFLLCISVRSDQKHKLTS